MTSKLTKARVQAHKAWTHVGAKNERAMLPIVAPGPHEAKRVAEGHAKPLRGHNTGKATWKGPKA